MPYTNLTKSDRRVIAMLLTAGMSQSDIGREIQRSKGTISREIARNSIGRGKRREYVGAAAHELAAQRRKEASLRKTKLTESALLGYVKAKLKLQWSPEQIAGRLKQTMTHDLSRRISHVSIYSWIRQDRKNGGAYHKHLRQSKRRRRRKKGSLANYFSVPDKVSIKDRPQIVDRRQRMGDWEGDLVQGKEAKSYLVTLVERRSGYLIFKRVQNKKSHVVRKAIVTMLKRVPKRFRKTLTFDNGTEFSEFKKMESALSLKVYFANPYSSWERGTNENTNSLIRQYLYKGRDFVSVSRKELARIHRRINNRPRKRLHYKTPNEVFKPT